MAKSVNKKAEQELKSNQFVYNGNTYEVMYGKVMIPDLGVLTAAEVALEPLAQKHLVDAGCVGSVLKQIFN